ncbi:MAG: CocE/NonD family hydrolase [Pseudomonadota bacterium]
MVGAIGTVWPVTVTDHLWIEMPDGVRLAGRLWLPRGAGPVPGILEYIPYRKADMVRARDERTHPVFAAHGYACLRVDMRGSGDSEGHMPDMYAEAELADARHVIEWMARQPWCTGRIGMFGTSWGGTASLQSSVEAPVALKAVIAVCATHDRYTDDIHHMGGCALTDSVEWGATLPAILAAPPTPNAGPGWQEMWRNRLDALTFPLERWLREDGRGAYWRHGSVIHEADRLSVPILAVGGWSDRYSNSVMALVAARPDLVWGVIGPWGHHYPDQGHPGPAMGFQALALDWWDRWLGDHAPTPSDWPRLRVWVREHEPPEDVIEQRAGQWIQTGPSGDEVRPCLWHLSEDGLAEAAAGGPWTVPLDLAIGRSSGDTGYFGRYGGLPADQAEDDARSLSFETPPLGQDLIVYGDVSVALHIDCREPGGQIALRLCDVAPDGTAMRITYAVRNLALDEALEETSALPRGDVRVPLHTTAYRVRAGHRLRLALSASLWPLVWPAAKACPVLITGGALTLPVLPKEPQPLAVPLPSPDVPPAKTTYTLRTAPQIERLVGDDAQRLVSGWHQPDRAVAFSETRTVFSFETRAEHQLVRADPGSAQAAINHRLTFDRPDGRAEVRSEVTVRTENAAFVVDGALEVDWQGATIHRRAWSSKIRR